MLLICFEREKVNADSFASAFLESKKKDILEDRRCREKKIVSSHFVPGTFVAKTNDDRWPGKSLEKSSTSRGFQVVLIAITVLIIRVFVERVVV